MDAKYAAEAGDGAVHEYELELDVELDVERVPLWELVLERQCWMMVRSF